MHVGNWKEREGGGAVADLGKRRQLRREPKGGRRGVTRKRGRVETQLQIWEEGRGGTAAEAGAERGEERGFLNHSVHT